MYETKKNERERFILTEEREKKSNRDDDDLIHSFVFFSSFSHPSL